MKNFKKKMAVLAAAGMFAIASLSGCGDTVRDDAAAVKVGDETITAGVVNFFARMQQAQYETYYAALMGTTGEQMWSQQVDEKNTYEDMVKEGIIKSLEDMCIIRQHAKEYGAELTDEENKAIDEAAENFIKANEEETLKAVSGSAQNIKEALRLMTVQDKMHKLMTADVSTEVSDEEAAQKGMQYVILSFTKPKEDGTEKDVSEEEKAQMRDTIQDMIDLVKAGGAEDLKAAAAHVKEGKNLPFEVEVKTATFDAKSAYPSEEIVKAADALEKEGDLTALIEDKTTVGAAQLTSLLDREATDKKKESIVTERKNKVYTDLLDGWREETKISVEEDVLKKIDFKKQGVKAKQKPAGDDQGKKDNKKDEKKDDKK